MRDNLLWLIVLLGISLLLNIIFGMLFLRRKLKMNSNKRKVNSIGETASSNRSSDIHSPAVNDEASSDLLPVDDITDETTNSLSKCEKVVETTTPSKQPPSLLHVQVFSFPGSDHDFQDAFYYCPDTGAVAIADGATVSVCQQEWAEILTRQFAESAVDIDNEADRHQWWINSITEWNQLVTPRQERWSADPAKYWVTTKLFHEVGAAATFIGFVPFFRDKAVFLTEAQDEQLEKRTDLEKDHQVKVKIIEGIDSSNGYQLSSDGYQLYAVGDCVGFWFEEDHLVRTEPPSLVFDCTPALLRSRQPFPLEHLHVFGDQQRPGNLLVLATDALAEYFTLHRPWEGNVNFWSKWQHQTDQDFALWAEKLKSNDLLKTDDYTMILVRFT